MRTQRGAARSHEAAGARLEERQLLQHPLHARRHARPRRQRRQHVHAQRRALGARLASTSLELALSALVHLESSKQNPGVPKRFLSKSFEPRRKFEYLNI